LNRLAGWCEANALELNVDKCKSITFSRLRHPIEFLYMLDGIILDRVDSINDLGVIMDSKVSFTGHIDVTVGMVLALLWLFVKKLSCEFRDPYTLKTHTDSDSLFHFSFHFIFIFIFEYRSLRGLFVQQLYSSHHLKSLIKEKN
jgi:hypothetical protein